MLIAQIKEALHGLNDINISDRKQWLSWGSNGVKHLRSGKIPKGMPMAGTPVVAFGCDELGNVVAICHDGLIRQYVQGDKPC